MRFEKKIYNNAFWMMSEKIISIFGLLFVTSYVAKYVGPTTFGQISLAIAIFQVVQIIAQMGGDNLIFKRLSRKIDSGITLMKASGMLRSFSYIFLSLFIITYFYLFVNGDSYIYITAVCLAYFFSTIDVYLIYNNATLTSKINTISNVIGLSIGLLIRYLIAYFKLEPYYLVIPIIITTLIPFLLRFIIFKVNINKLAYQKRNIDKNKIKKYSSYMIYAGIGIVASSISVAIYSRINQFMLGAIDGISSVGIYSVAITLGTSWVFISQSLISSFFSKIYSERDDDSALYLAAKLNRIIFIISVLFILVIILFGHSILTLLYGDEYLDAYIPMILISFVALLSSLGTISYRYIVRFSGYYFLSKKMFSLLLFSLPLSYFFIINYGTIGAAVSSIIIEFLSLTLFNYLFRNGVVFKMHKISIFRGGK